MTMMMELLAVVLVMKMVIIRIIYVNRSHSNEVEVTRVEITIVGSTPTAEIQMTITTTEIMMATVPRAISVSMNTLITTIPTVVNDRLLVIHDSRIHDSTFTCNAYAIDTVSLWEAPLFP